MVNAITVVVLAARALNQPALAADKAYGWHETAEVANAVAVGSVFTSRRLVIPVSSSLQVLPLGYH